MSESDDRVFALMLEVQRELGGVNEHLRTLDSKVTETLAQARATNGRVNEHDKAIAVLQSREGRIEEMEERFDEVDARPRVYALGIGGPVIAAIVGVLVAHVA